MLSRFTKNYEKAGWNGEEIIEYMRKIFCYRDVMISKKTEEIPVVFIIRQDIQKRNWMEIRKKLNLFH